MKTAPNAKIQMTAHYLARREVATAMAILFYWHLLKIYFFVVHISNPQKYWRVEI